MRPQKRGGFSNPVKIVVLVEMGAPLIFTGEFSSLVTGFVSFCTCHILYLAECYCWGALFTPLQ